MLNVRMIVTDLDNTLLRRDKTISDYTVDVFRRVRNIGVMTVFATARSLESTQEFHYVLRPDGEIVTGGCFVYAGTELLKSYYLPEPQGEKLLAELDACPAIKRVSVRSLSESYSNVPMVGRTYADFQSPLPEKLVHCSCRTDDAELMKSIAARYPEFAFLHVSESDLYDINPKDATKLSGVRTIAEHFGVPLSVVAAFGDDNSDVEMLDVCGIGVAMGNAIDECKSVADYVCGDCDNDGAARWIEENVLSSD